MTNPFSWIGEIANALGAFVPTWVHLECTDVGVAIKRGDRVRALPPGITWYWPFWTSVYQRPANRQTVNLAAQALTTADDATVAAGCMVRFRIDDAVRSLVDTDDVEGSINDETVAVLKEIIQTRTMSEIRGDPKTNTALTLKARSQLKDYGVYVERAQLTDFAKARTLIHVGLNLVGAAEPSEE